LDLFWQLVRFHLLITLVILRTVLGVPAAHRGA
jgi:hypothetical protein